MSSPVLVKEIPLEKEYKKATLITPADISKLRQWLDTQPHLPADLITELELILTYHCCERSAEVSKQVLDLHFTLKTLFTSFFKDRAVDATVLNAANTVLALPLDMRTAEGYAAFYARLLDTDVKKFIFSDSLRMVLMLLDLWHLEDGTWPGLVIVIDLDGLTLGHLARLELLAVQQFLYYLQEAMLVKLKSVHFLNAPPFMDKLMMILRPFMKKKLMDMINIHQVGATTIEKFVPREAMPKDIGGEFKTFQQAKDDIITRLKLNADFFAIENKKRVTESLRPGKPKTITDIFGGIEGSFKKLDID
ncbi:alpha-tocopherol transfer protein-like [Pectinophora gossypiella]|uniref:alpha-tocopherol transfer protein-like n=1 Tax=Pectinophora gossypiella TaxID=13191 RepID=UPI00214E36DC|nr:alpha-tocopherol transfer protein-like [Pectinophora gossypiella]